MNIKPIKTETDYQAALRAIDKLFDAKPDTPEGDRLDVMVTLAEAYEAKHHPVPLPDPIEAIEFHMERLGLTRKDLELCIGSRARVADILNRRRLLTLDMIRKLEEKLGIPAAVLVQKYDLVPAHADQPTVGFESLPCVIMQDTNKVGTSEPSPSLAMGAWWKGLLKYLENIPPIPADSLPQRNPYLWSASGQAVVASRPEGKSL
jgi:HTH-type transcriptional regulator / antitoxin HigA